MSSLTCPTLLDRLRDLERDRSITPERARFVAAHRRALLGLAVGAGAACLPPLAELVSRAGPAPMFWLAPLAHRTAFSKWISVLAALTSRSMFLITVISGSLRMSLPGTGTFWAPALPKSPVVVPMRLCCEEPPQSPATSDSVSV